ncbi:MAG: shikimate dehydrogenase [Gammaproteobacteria bacterium]|nr:shikimate dehydrogenase [Gammaproteobacteria bacterium]
MGNPIAHSKSPQIHAAFAKQTGEPIVYQAIFVERGQFSRALDKFQHAGGKGLNITLPFKQEAWSLAQHRTQRADRARAVNTLWFDEHGERYGDNTDGAGLVRDILINHGGRIKGDDLLVLGAGGAARGILEPLLAEGPARVVLANRTVSKAEELIALFGDLGELWARGYDALSGEQFHLIINGTSLSLRSEVPPLPNEVLAPGGWCYDMMYADEPTAFVRWGNAHGAAKSLDGLGMLVEQAADSFQLWRGVRPDTDQVIHALRSK